MPTQREGKRQRAAWWRNLRGRRRSDSGHAGVRDPPLSESRPLPSYDWIIEEIAVMDSCAARLPLRSRASLRGSPCKGAPSSRERGFPGDKEKGSTVGISADKHYRANLPAKEYWICELLAIKIWMERVSNQVSNRIRSTPRLMGFISGEMKVYPIRYSQGGETFGFKVNTTVIFGITVYIVSFRVQFESGLHGTGWFNKNSRLKWIVNPLIWNLEDEW